jgi:hypothetical protein
MPLAQVHTFSKPGKTEAADLVRRATVAWLQTGGTELPSASSAFKMHRGLGYVVLRGAEGVLAVYRVRPDNMALRRMKRWPEVVGR